MLVKISEDENHNKIAKPIAGATLGQGVPLGTWCSFEKDVAPSNNWLMAGTTFDASVYPALNLYLGTNVVPSRYDHDRPSEWEEVVATTSTVTPVNAQYDGLITVTVSTNQARYLTVNGVNYNRFSGADTNTSITVEVKKGDVVSVSGSVASYYVSACYYTHPLFIKATSIASDTDQQSILAQIQAYNTYSTEETLTGKTWIDGKPIYRKCFDNLSLTFSSNAWGDFGIDIPTNAGQLVYGLAIGTDYAPQYKATFSASIIAFNTNNNHVCIYGGSNAGTVEKLIIEYTKTND